MAQQLLNYRFAFALLALFVISCVTPSYAQSPKKLLANGYYEQAFLKAARKQNKKVKIKKKFTNVIYPAYEKIYGKGESSIASANFDWKSSYDQLIRVVSFRSKVTHPGVVDNLNNMLFDENVLINLSNKFNFANRNDLDAATVFENQEKYIKALDLYMRIDARQKQAAPITTFKDRLELIDTEQKIKNAHQKIGDQFIDEAKALLYKGSKEDAKESIQLINKAKSYRPLDSEEQELLKLANLIIRDSWMQEAKNLLLTKTKRNGRLAHDLIRKTRSIQSLTEEEEKMLQEAKEIGMTRIRVIVKNKGAIHTSKNLSGILNKKRKTDWIAYYDMDSDATIDFDLEVRSMQPKVVLYDVRRRLEQRSKTVEYTEQETDDAGNVVDVKKTKTVTAMVAILSRDKDATVRWTITLTDKLDGKTVYSETNQSVILRTNEFASVESGDILALPENIESEVALDSQPFPTDEEIQNLAKQLYLKELNIFLGEKKDHLLNVDLVLE